MQAKSVQNKNRELAKKEANAKAAELRDQEKFESQGILGKMPENVESIAELMLWDSDVNVYQESKVQLKEEAFNIRGKKQKTRAQKEEIIHDRRTKAKEKYEKIKKEQAK